MMAALAATALTAACQSGAHDNAPAAIALSSSMTELTASTRAASLPHVTAAATNFATVDKAIALFITEANDVAGATLTHTGTLHLLDTDGTGGLAFDDAVTYYWPASGNRLNFYAWYPAVRFAGQTAESSIDIILPANQSQATDYAASDLMFGAPRGDANAVANPVTRPTVTTVTPLGFTHALSQVMIVLQQDAEQTLDIAQLQDATVTLSDVNLTATVDVDGGTATAKDGAATALLTIMEKDHNETKTTGFAVVPPGQNLKGKTLTITLKDGGVKTWTLTKDANTQAGKRYTYTVTLSTTAIQVSSTITDWTEGTGGDAKSLTL